MISKYEAEQIIRIYVPKFKNSLQLKKWKINFHVYKSTSKKLKKLKLNKLERLEAMGVSFISDSSKSADIILYYDQIANRTDGISTLLHELLHVRFSYLVNLVTLKYQQANKEEEKVVQILERMMMEYMNK